MRWFVGQTPFEAVPPSTVVSQALTRQGEIIMATYIVLTSFTDQGVRNAKYTTKRGCACAPSARRRLVSLVLGRAATKRRCLH
jgi:hypothetical protein